MLQDFEQRKGYDKLWSATAGNCPFLPYNNDSETSALLNNTNNIKAQVAVIGTKRSFDIFMLARPQLPD